MTSGGGLDLAAALGGFGLAAWSFLLLARGGFWRVRPQLPAADAPSPAPRVVAVVPARNEADVLPDSLPTLLAQDYPGEFRIQLVDDRSEDGTAEVARRLAADAGCEERLRVLEAPPLEAGWTGKLWALSRGLEAASLEGAPDYWLFTDADIGHPVDSVRALVAQAEGEDLDLVSIMARLRASAPWERLLIPAFVYFFAKLYPFAWSNTPGARTAAAAGGCVLLRAGALEAAGGIEAIRGEIIDDVALGTLLKRRGRPGGGRTWLGYRYEVESLRGYDDLAEIWQMVARTAFTELRHSTLLLVGTVFGMLLVYLGPPIALVAGVATGSALATGLGAAAWLLQAVSYRPMLAFYGVAPGYAFALPLVATLYVAMTFDSARRWWQGRGGGWKGRTY